MQFQTKNTVASRCLQRNLRIPTIIASAALLVSLCLSLSSFAKESASRCKYSVRDVAFVNVHGNAWQLQLVKPENSSDEQFAQWNQILKQQLTDSNVDPIWLAAESSEAKRLLQYFNDEAQSQPMMALTGPNNSILPVKENSQDAFEHQIANLVDSDYGKQILQLTVDSLCVIVLVASANESENKKARAIVSEAQEQLKRQMWTLEKPTDKGPAVVEVPHQIALSSWLTKSLGIDAEKGPSVAIVFGQGRRLGNVLTGANINTERIIGQASICGQDCECALDRNWLYGTQMIHVWNKQLERAAEESLSFDPNSALVIAEVAQILQKNRAGGKSDDRLPLGGGLVIHDLEPVEQSNPTKLDEENTASSPIKSPTPETVRHDPKPKPLVQPEPRQLNLPSRNTPWALIIGLAALLVSLFAWLQFIKTRA